MAHSPRKPTRAQKQTLAEWRKVFGKDNIKAHTPRAHDGIIRVEAKAHAGTWEWSLNTDGELVYSCFTMPLFDVPATGKPRKGTLDEYLSGQHHQGSDNAGAP